MEEEEEKDEKEKEEAAPCNIKRLSSGADSSKNPQDTVCAVYAQKKYMSVHACVKQVIDLDLLN